eukprot:3019835-Prymnesium_polylepis.1
MPRRGTRGEGAQNPFSGRRFAGAAPRGTSVGDLSIRLEELLARVRRRLVDRDRLVLADAPQLRIARQHRLPALVVQPQRDRALLVDLLPEVRPPLALGGDLRAHRLLLAPHAARQHRTLVRCALQALLARVAREALDRARAVLPVLEQHRTLLRLSLLAQ